ncbi:hypothetical protein GMDG_08975, partial [Pseudogymnoascus destructans 20631-21]
CRPRAPPPATSATPRPGPPRPSRTSSRRRPINSGRWSKCPSARPTASTPPPSWRWTGLKLSPPTRATPWVEETRLALPRSGPTGWARPCSTRPRRPIKPRTPASTAPARSWSRPAGWSMRPASARSNGWNRR